MVSFTVSVPCYCCKKRCTIIKADVSSEQSTYPNKKKLLCQHNDVADVKYYITYFRRLAQLSQKLDEKLNVDKVYPFKTN